VCRIRRSHSGVVENLGNLGCYAVSTAKWLTMFRRKGIPISPGSYSPDVSDKYNASEVSIIVYPFGSA